MSPPKPAFYAGGTSTPQGPIDFGALIGGTATAIVAVDIWNARGDATAEDARQVEVIWNGREAGDPNYSTAYRAVAERWLQWRIVAALGGAPALTTSWAAVGRGRRARVPVPIPTNSGYSTEWRVVAPPGVPDMNPQLLMELDYAGHSRPLEEAHHAAGLRGILSGLGDGIASFVVDGFALTASGTPDVNIQVADGSYVFLGLPVALLAQALATTATDSASASLAAGEAYPITLSLGAAGITATKGLKAAAPLSSGSYPQAPAGELLVGHVQRPQAGGITAGDIFQATEYGLFALTGTSLTRILGGGQALVDDSVVDYQRGDSLTVPASTAAARVWLIGSTGARVVTATPTLPDPRALALYEAVTSGSDITTLTDLRTYCRARRADIRFRFGAVLVAGQYSYATTRDEGRLLLRPPLPILAVLDDLGITATAGASLFDIERWTGSAWVSIFSTSPDRRPSIAYNAGDLRSYGRPTSTVLPPGARLRATCVSVPTAAVSPSGAEVVIFGELE